MPPMNIWKTATVVHPLTSVAPIYKRSWFMVNLPLVYLFKKNRMHPCSETYTELTPLLPRPHAPTHRLPSHPHAASLDHSSRSLHWQWRMGQPATGTLPAGDSYDHSSRLTARATCQVAERLRPLITSVTWSPQPAVGEGELRFRDGCVFGVRGGYLCLKSGTDVTEVGVDGGEGEGVGGGASC